MSNTQTNTQSIDSIDDELTSQDIIRLLQNGSSDSIIQLDHLAKSGVLRDYDDLFTNSAFYQSINQLFRTCWQDYDACHLESDGSSGRLFDDNRHSRAESGDDDEEDEMGAANRSFTQSDLDRQQQSWDRLQSLYEFLTRLLTFAEFNSDQSISCAVKRGCFDAPFITSVIRRFEPRYQRATHHTPLHQASEISRIAGVGAISGNQSNDQSAPNASKFSHVPASILASVGIFSQSNNQSNNQSAGVGIGVQTKAPDAPTQQELDLLRTLVHSLYKSLIPHRKSIVQSIFSFFSRFVRLPLTPHSIPELLSIIGAIVKGWKLPLLPSHSAMILREIMPLHSPNRMINELTPMIQHYHEPLVYVLITFLKKEQDSIKQSPNKQSNDPTASTTPPSLHSIFSMLLSSWPTSAQPNSAKEVLLLHELEQLLEFMDPAAFKQSINQFLPYLISSLSSSHARVSERCLQLWQNDHWLACIKSQSHSIFPSVVSALLQEKHWNTSVNKMRVAVLESCLSQDPDLFRQCVHRLFRCQTEQESLAKAESMLNSMRPPPDPSANQVESIEAQIPSHIEHVNYNEFVFGHLLGSGSFSTVRYAKRIIKGQPASMWPEYAIKIIDQAVIDANNYQSNIEREIRISSQLKHPNINALVATCSNRQHLYCVLEYAKQGDLFTALSARGSLELEAARFIAAEVLSAMEFMHAHRIVWGDCKPENVLIHTNGHVKCTDFGSSRFFDECSVTDRIEGTEDYLAPELMRQECPMSQATDLWAWACTLYQLLAGRTPMWAGELEQSNNQSLKHTKSGRITKSSLHSAVVCHTQNKLTSPTSNQREQKESMVARMVHFEGLNDKFPEQFDESARDLICKILVPQPGDRYGVSIDKSSNRPQIEYKMLKQHPFFASIDFNHLASQRAPKLGVGNVAPAPDAKWARRKNSMMWAPMPQAYQFSSSAFVLEALIEHDSERASSAPVKSTFTAYAAEQQRVMPGLKEVEGDDDDNDEGDDMFGDDDFDDSDSDDDVMTHSPVHHSSRAGPSIDAPSISSLPPPHPAAASIPRPRLGIHNAPPRAVLTGPTRSFVPDASPLVGVPGMSALRQPMGNPVANALLNRMKQQQSAASQKQ